MKLDKNMVAALLAFGGGKGGGIVPSGTLSISANGTYDVGAFASAVVAVPASAVVSGTKSISANGTHDVTAFANAEVLVPASAVCSGTKSISSNGIHDVVGFANVDVNVAASGGIEDALIQRTISGSYINNNILSIGYYAFARCQSLQYIEFNNVTSIETGAFYDCGKLLQALFPNIEDGIPPYAFYSCKSLTYVSIASGSYGTATHPYVSNHAFYSCINLQNIVLPENLTIVRASAFEGCSALQSFDYPYAVADGHAFCNCSALSYVRIRAFAYAQASVTSGGRSCFCNCTNLEQVVFPGFNQTYQEGAQDFLGQSAFYNCQKLKTVEGMNHIGTTTIGSSAFCNCYALTEIKPYIKTRSLQSYAFASCSSLGVFKLMTSSQTTINTGAFANDLRLSSLYIYDKNASICKLAVSGAFYNTPIADNTTYVPEGGKIYVLDTCYASYINATNWVTFSSKIVSLTASEMASIFAAE